jgi:hypothetical protein
MDSNLAMNFLVKDWNSDWQKVKLMDLMMPKMIRLLMPMVKEKG